ncbi:MAG TPA: phosphatidylglycerophosphatase A, partial [Acetobacteraceae bacterium]
MSLAALIAGGFGAGRIPYAPGTAGSLLGLVLGAVILAWAPKLLPACCLLASLAGWWAIRAARVEGDPGWVVIDEVAGQLVALLPLDRPAPVGLLAAFLLFRLLDIAKPGPV